MVSFIASLSSQVANLIEQSLIDEVSTIVSNEYKIPKDDIIRLLRDNLDLDKMSPGQPNLTVPGVLPPVSQPSKRSSRSPSETCLYLKKANSDSPSRCETSRTAGNENGFCKTHFKSAGGRKQREQLCEFHGTEDLSSVEEPLSPDQMNVRTEPVAANMINTGFSTSSVSQIPQDAQHEIMSHISSHRKMKNVPFVNWNIHGKNYLKPATLDLIFDDINGERVLVGRWKKNKLVRDLSDLTEQEKAWIREHEISVMEECLESKVSSTYDTDDLEELDDSFLSVDGC